MPMPRKRASWVFSVGTGTCTYTNTAAINRASMATMLFNLIFFMRIVCFIIQLPIQILEWLHRFSPLAGQHVCIRNVCVLFYISLKLGDINATLLLLYCFQAIHIDKCIYYVCIQILKCVKKS